MNKEIQVGDYLRFSHTHLFQVVTLNCRVYKVAEGKVSFVVPDRARTLAFPPFKGWRCVALPVANAAPAHAAWKRRQAQRTATAA